MNDGRMEDLISQSGLTPASTSSSPITQTYGYSYCYLSDASTPTPQGVADSHGQHPTAYMNNYTKNDASNNDFANYSPSGSSESVHRTHNGHRRIQSGSGSTVNSGRSVRSSNRDNSTTSPTSTSEPSKKKQKRNKPTLSCFSCVERKTKASIEYILQNYPFSSFCLFGLSNL